MKLTLNYLRVYIFLYTLIELYTSRVHTAYVYNSIQLYHTAYSVYVMHSVPIMYDVIISYITYDPIRSYSTLVYIVYTIKSDHIAHD